MNRLLVVLALLIPVLADAQALRRLRPDPEAVKSKNWERWQQEVPVSGDVRVGLMATDDQRLTLDSLQIFLPPFTERTLCIELSSQDGRYSAHLRYPLEGLTPGTVNLDLPTSYARELSQYDPQRIAILAGLSNDCNEAAQAYVVARWNSRPLSPSVLVMLNSRLPARIRGGDGSLTFECLPLDGVTTAFNLRCEIPLASLAGRPTLVVEMRRGAGITRLPLPIRLP